MNRFDSSHLLRDVFSGENRKPALILLTAPIALASWRCFLADGLFPAPPGLPGGLLSGAAAASEWVADLTSFALLGLVPLALIALVLKEPLAEYGLAVGDWRFGLKALAATAPVIVAVSALASRSPQFQAQYPLFPGACASLSAFGAHAAAYLLYYVGFEVFFRGFVQFGLRERLGDVNALLVQTALSCLVHLGKPSGEIFGAIVGGLAFGFVAFRSRSLLYVIVAHWMLGVTLDLFICLG